MDKVREKTAALKEELRTDATLQRIGEIAHTNPKTVLPAVAEYSLGKFPIIEWLPRYQPSWFAQDFMAGLTIGVMLIPQGLAYAQIATIPIENGLYSSWIPAAVAVFMGTSKDLSSGPTSMIGLLTSQIIVDLQDEFTPAQISTAVALMVGVYGLILGMLELGFILDYVSAPVLTGFISATALVIGFGQVSSLIGLSNMPSGVFQIIGDMLKRLPYWDGPTCGIGFGSIFMLLILEKIGKVYGKKHFLIKYLSSSRAVIVLVVFTLISWGVNHNLDAKHYVFAVSKVHTNGILAPTVPLPGLVSRVAGRSIAPFMACALEHLAVGKAFGRKNGYTIGQSQELNYLGVTNIVNSFFHVMPVGGAMSRTAVNSECHVRSPLYGIVTAGFILLTLYVFSPALYWLPKATLAAIIIMAVLHLFGPLSLFWRYWRISLADFIACNVAFWVTIFVSAEIGIGAAAGFSIVWSLVRSAFAKPIVRTGGSSINNFNDDRNNTSYPTSTTSSSSLSSGGFPNADRRPTNATDNSEKATATEIETLARQDTLMLSSTGGAINHPLPEDTAVVRFTENIYFPNAYRCKTTALEGIQLVYPPASAASTTSPRRERIWTVAAERRLDRLRAQHDLRPRGSPLALVVWDMTRVSWIDTTGIIALGELKDDIHRQLGGYVQIRMAGVSARVRRKFWRAKWKLVDSAESRAGVEGDVVYETVEDAVWRDREGLGLLEKGSFEGVTLEKE